MTNDTSELRAILRRVDTLEAENRRLKHLGLAALILLGSLAVMGQTASKDRIVEARAFVLRDVNGKSRATLGLSPDGPFLRMWGPGGGNEQVLLSLDDRGPSLAFADPDGKRRVVLTILKSTPILWLLDKNQEARVSLRADLDGRGALTLSDSEGFKAAVGSADLVTQRTGETHKEVGRFRRSDRQGQQSAVVCAVSLREGT